MVHHSDDSFFGGGGFFGGGLIGPLIPLIGIAIVAVVVMFNSDTTKQLVTTAGQTAQAAIQQAPAVAQAAGPLALAA
jgi:hypothetical protein